ncbi:hypothetical protein EDB89DRAFT_1901214 [Lactarius sanguifluus]|nr:hypothetical protein EDB89DRAFT_1901214 [Lactarius sanguifluus]
MLHPSTTIIVRVQPGYLGEQSMPPPLLQSLWLGHAAASSSSQHTLLGQLVLDSQQWWLVMDGTCGAGAAVAVNRRGGTWVSWLSAVGREQSVEAAVGWVYETKWQWQKNRRNGTELENTSHAWQIDASLHTVPLFCTYIPTLLFAVPVDSTYCLTNSIVTAATIPPHPAVLVPPSFVDAASPGSTTLIQ